MIKDLRNIRQELNKTLMETLNINPTTHNSLRNELGVVSILHESFMDLNYELSFNYIEEEVI